MQFPFVCPSAHPFRPVTWIDLNLFYKKKPYRRFYFFLTKNKNRHASVLIFKCSEIIFVYLCDVHSWSRMYTIIRARLRQRIVSICCTIFHRHQFYYGAKIGKKQHLTIMTTIFYNMRTDTDVNIRMDVCGPSSRISFIYFKPRQNHIIIY